MCPKQSFVGNRVITFILLSMMAFHAQSCVVMDYANFGSSLDQVQSMQVSDAASLQAVELAATNFFKQELEGDTRWRIWVWLDIIFRNSTKDYAGNDFAEYAGPKYPNEKYVSPNKHSDVPVVRCTDYASSWSGPYMYRDEIRLIKAYRVVKSGFLPKRSDGYPRAYVDMEIDEIGHSKGVQQCNRTFVSENKKYLLHLEHVFVNKFNDGTNDRPAYWYIETLDDEWNEARVPGYLSPRALREFYESEVCRIEKNKVLNSEQARSLILWKNNVELFKNFE